jgi:hypothetical protein
MQKQFDKEYAQQNKGCYENEQLQKCSFMSLDVITIESILDSEISIKDKYWFVCKKLATQAQNQQIAIGVALIVVEIFEEKYPDNKVPRKAIESAQAYLKGELSLELLIQAKNATADAADAAANAAVYADAAVYAAYAADAAANAAVYAADAAYAAATAAAYAANAAAYAAYAAYADAYDNRVKDAKDYTVLLLDFLRKFVENAE